MALPFSKIELIYPYKFRHVHNVDAASFFDVIANSLHHMGFYKEAHTISQSTNFLSEDYKNKDTHSLTDHINEVFDNKKEIFPSLKAHFTKLEFKDEFDLLSGLLRQDSIYFMTLRMSNGKDSGLIAVAKNVIFSIENKEMLPLTRASLSLCCDTDSNYLHVASGEQLLPNVSFLQNHPIVYRENDSKYSGLTTVAELLHCRGFSDEAKEMYDSSKRITDDFYEEYSEYEDEIDFLNEKYDTLFCKSFIFEISIMPNYETLFEYCHKKHNGFVLAKFINQNAEISRWFGLFDDIIIDNSLSQGIVWEQRALDFCCKGKFCNTTVAYLFQKADENVIHFVDDDDEPEEKKQKL